MNEQNNDHQKRLMSVLQSIEEQMEKQNSIRYTLVRGVIYGLGIVIGSTVLFAFASSIFIRIFGPLG